jgi:3-hydroxyisobutyrate dehydrogenase
MYKGRDRYPAFAWGCNAGRCSAKLPLKKRNHKTMTSKSAVGFVGLGDLGEAMAKRIIEAGFPTTLWARRSAALLPFGGSVYRDATSLADLGLNNEIVCVCVFDSSDVRDVLLGNCGILSGMSPGSIVIIHSTIDVPTCREIAAVAQARGISVLDAPVAGRRADALEGKLIVMVGGDSTTVERAMPLLQTVGCLIRHVGPLGSGQILKALNNVTSFCNGRIAVLAIETGRALGLDEESVISILRTGGARSRMLETIVDTLMPDEAFQVHAKSLVAKDTANFRDICHAAGLQPSLLDQLAADWVEQLIPQGTGPRNQA